MEVLTKILQQGTEFDTRGPLGTTRQPRDDDVGQGRVEHHFDNLKKNRESFICAQEKNMLQNRKLHKTARGDVE